MSSFIGPSTGSAISIRPQRRRVERNASVNPIARALLAGALLDSNEASPLRELSSCVQILEVIFEQVRAAWKEALVIGPERTEEGFADGNWTPERNYHFNAMQMLSLSEKWSLIQLPSVRFPPPEDIVVNMMPFNLSSIHSLPNYLKPYYGIIEECITPSNLNWWPDPKGQEVAYLTVHESRATEHEPQRRGGIHTEGMLSSAPDAQWFSWGEFNGLFGGIFCASTVSKSARMWNAKIPREPSAALGEGCDIEHLRGVLDDTAEWVEPEAGELYWMTDATPHESLPLEPGTYRQYFRLVVGKIGGWYEQHSTKNALGVEPDCPVLKHNKFEDA